MRLGFHWRHSIYLRSFQTASSCGVGCAAGVRTAMAELEDELQELEDDGEAVDYEDYDLEEEEDEEELQLGPGARLGALAHALAGRCEARVLHWGCAGCFVFRKAQAEFKWHRRCCSAVAVACICAACERLPPGCEPQYQHVTSRRCNWQAMVASRGVRQTRSS